VSKSSDENAKIGARLRWAREQAGLSQGQVAKAFDFHRPTISQIEAGERAVKAEEVSQFADLYEVDGEWILRGDDAVPGKDDPRIELAARELRKLSREDLDTILRLVRVLKTNKE
jgi:transcriptional regulator with XRE-family HTH domain